MTGTVKWELAYWADHCGVNHDVECLGIYEPYIQERERFGSLEVRKRQGMVPDLRTDVAGRSVLWDVKCVHQGRASYPGSVQKLKCGLVNRRARNVNKECVWKAKKLDKDFNGHDFEIAGGPGPVLRQLQDFGTVRGLAFGPRGESSEGVDDFITLCAEVGAERLRAGMGAKTREQARSALKHQMYISLGVLGFRLRSRLIRKRLQLALNGGAVVESRRWGARARHVSGRELYEEYCAAIYKPY